MWATKLLKRLERAEAQHKAQHQSVNLPPIWTPYPGPQSMALVSLADEMYYGGAAGGGKAVSLDTPIRTVAGWKTMGELTSSDYVFGSDGKPIRVLQAHDVLYGRECYEIEFDTGEKITADAEHLWHTFTAQDLAGLTRKDPAWRERRRARRRSRATGKRSELFTAAITARNKAKPAAAKSPPTGGVRTTKSILETLETHTGRKNHAIQLPKPIELPPAELQLDPYLFGLWLGDGSSYGGLISTADTEILESWHDGGFKTRHYKAYDYGIYKLKVVLRSLGVLRNKHVPREYLQASYEQRLALLQGLMDTDGYAHQDGSVEFDNTNKRLADAVLEIVYSLGWKPTYHESRAKLNGVDCGPKWRVVWRPTVPVFRLQRKAVRHRIDNLRRTQSFRYVAAVRPVDSVPVRCITVDAADSLYLVGRGLIPTHNTQLGIGLSLLHHRNTLFLRRQQTDAKAISDVYRELPARAGRWRSNGYGGEFRTMDGRLIEVGGCQHEDDWKKYAGHAHCLKAFDELPQFSKKQYTTIIAWNRVRNPAKYPNQRVRSVGFGNPPTDPSGEWVLEYWRDWLEATGGVVAGAGALRWYVRVDGDDKEIQAETGDKFEHKGKTYQPRSRTFIPARVEDNPEYMRQGYDAVLNALPEPFRSQMRYGDMSARRDDDRWQLIPTAWIEAAMRRWAERHPTGWPELSQIGCDVAMQGVDNTCVATRHGPNIVKIRRVPGKKTVDGESVVLILREEGAEDVPTLIDTIGIGKSAYDVGNLLGLKTLVAHVNSSATNYRDPKVRKIEFLNLRAAVYWHLRTLLDPEGGPPETRLALPPDRELKMELMAHRFKQGIGGIQIRAKEEIKGEIGRSPDAADAVTLACWEKKVTFLV